jgi:hypothetical protein
MLLTALLGDSISLAKAEDIGKGVLIVRGGAANSEANYDKEDRDINGRLQGVSALCANSGNQTASALIQTDNTRTWEAYMSGNTTTVINYGGHVVKDPLDGNPNHCLINGLKLPQIKGMWH